jgi:hypothetical protein
MSYWDIKKEEKSYFLITGLLLTIFFSVFLVSILNRIGSDETFQLITNPFGIGFIFYTLLLLLILGIFCLLTFFTEIIIIRKIMLAIGLILVFYFPIMLFGFMLFS